MANSVTFLFFILVGSLLCLPSSDGLTDSEIATIAKNIRTSRIARSPDKDQGLFGDSGNGNPEDETAPAVIGNTKNKVGFLPLPPGYNKLVIPLGNISKEIFVMVHLSIREILDVDNDNGILEMDTEIGITWIDWEVWKYFIEDKEAQIKAASGPEEITLDAEFLKSIWKPDIFIEEMASVERTSLLAKLVNLRFLVKNPVMPGAITFEARQTVKVRCEMDFQYYPADIQVCPFNIRSYSYTQEQLFLLWNPNQRVYLDQIEDSNYDFQVSDVEPGEELYDLFTKSQAPCCQTRNYSTLTFTIQVRRNIKYHFVQTCVPSILLILITWLCFLLPPDMVEVRIGISMTTLLTLTAMFTAVREQSPSVSYTMAIDTWMVFCMFLLFLALVLFTVIYWLRRKYKPCKDEKDEETGPNGRSDTPVKASLKSKFYIKMVEEIKRYSFWSFAIIFIVFLITYGTWLIIASDYYSWDPSPNFNALPLEAGNETNRLFTKLDTPFKPTSKKKVVESTFRFKDIFKQVIFPRVQAALSAMEGSEEVSSEEVEDVEATTEAIEMLGNTTVSA